MYLRDRFPASIFCQIFVKTRNAVEPNEEKSFRIQWNSTVRAETLPAHQSERTRKRKSEREKLSGILVIIMVVTFLIEFRLLIFHEQSRQTGKCS